MGRLNTLNTTMQCSDQVNFIKTPENDANTQHYNK